MFLCDISVRRTVLTEYGNGVSVGLKHGMKYLRKSPTRGLQSPNHTKCRCSTESNRYFFLQASENSSRRDPPFMGTIPCPRLCNRRSEDLRCSSCGDWLRPEKPHLRR